MLSHRNLLELEEQDVLSAFTTQQLLSIAAFKDMKRSEQSIMDIYRFTPENKLRGIVQSAITDLRNAAAKISYYQRTIPDFVTEHVPKIQVCLANARDAVVASKESASIPTDVYGLLEQDTETLTARCLKLGLPPPGEVSVVTSQESAIAAMKKLEQSLYDGMGAASRLDTVLHAIFKRMHQASQQASQNLLSQASLEHNVVGADLDLSGWQSALDHALAALTFAVKWKDIDNPSPMLMLPHHVLLATFVQSGVGSSAWLLHERVLFCRKHFMEESTPLNRKTKHGVDGLRLYNGRLFSQMSPQTVSSSRSQPPQGKTPGLQKMVRLPHVLRVITGQYSTWAITYQGIFAWGNNGDGRLGVDSPESEVAVPVRVKFVLGHPTHMPRTTYIGLPGLSDPEWHQAQLHASLWCEGNSYAESGVTFLSLAGHLFATGCCTWGRLGIGSGWGRHVRAFVPVQLLPEIYPLNVIIGPGTTFMQCAGRQCYVCGDNDAAKLGVDTSTRSTRTPLPLPFAVDGVSTQANGTLFLSNNTVYATPTADPSLVPEEWRKSAEGELVIQSTAKEKRDESVSDSVSNEP
ncbi:Regulator of chromosome condensation (RCC1) repeat [Carpediemonas membranifera]|uniref:Regulator of chromosome condensation (RCC1) repeat n=1 Tax=Carpediemonas membranifera TaxID=201153 RepID=A0A8J6E0E9_9EUKA|nr:Regulator of chromosome condensation (RCC1) repeat [Carpediemonas membranifera]|eukprot:KAG9391751.1 Regulator of chromosome condensation (RCC1) repeat [Carpediemonas membranifera]